MQAHKFLLGLALFISLSAQAQTSPVVHFVWMGGNDCPPCVAWRKDELPKLQALDEFKNITFSYVIKSIRSTVPAGLFLPAAVKPFKDKLDYASSGRGGSPQAAIVVNGEVFDYFRTTRSASEIQMRLAAINTNAKYPFKRCIKASTEWGKCEIDGQD